MLPMMPNPPPPTAARLAIHMITVSMIALQRDAMHKSIDNSDPIRSHYDYIVVGAGTAGCVVARRLAENHGSTVLLLEAGGPQSFITDVPGMERPVFAPNSEYNWNYQLARQKRILQGRAVSGVYPEPKGKVIGGSSTINRMLYLRGNPNDFDNWEHQYGATGWSFKDVLPWFTKSENNTDHRIVNQSPGYHGTDGPLEVISDPNQNIFFNNMLKSYEDFGIPTIDLNGPNPVGAAITQLTIKDGFRGSTANAYIDPNPLPHNLFISPYSHVTRVLLSKNKSKLVANGVQFAKKGRLYEVMANKEVIVSAGSYGSPQILMLSGIGPEDHLSKVGIPVLADLPVGNNLHDHLQIVFLHPILNNTVIEAFPQLTIGQLNQLITKREGPLATTTALYTFYNTPSNKDRSWPNTLISNRMNVFSTNVREIISIFSAERAKEWAAYFEPYLGQPHLISEIVLRRSRSRGTVRLASANPFEHPIIDPNFLAFKEDFDDIMAVIKFQLYFLANSKISENLFQIPDPIPGCKMCADRPIWECDEYIACHINQIGQKEHHSVGTCRMGAVDRPDVVVDPRLRVKHVDGLRVCDASIQPEGPNSNSNANTIMIGERCAHFVLEENGYA